MSLLRKSGRALARPQRGQAILETALVLPILVTIVFGIAEIGLYMYEYVQATNCAREAARRASVRADDAELPPYCVSVTLESNLTLTPPNYTVQPGGTDIVATVDADYDWLVIDNLIPGLPSPMPLDATVVMRMEGEQV